MTEDLEPENPHDALLTLFEDAENDSTAAALIKLAKKGIVDPHWDDEENCYRWRLSEFGVHLCETEELEDFIAAAERPGLGEPEALKRSIKNE